MQDAAQVFDRAVVRRHRRRAAACLASHDFLIREIAERLADRLVDVKRRFPLALDVGCHSGQIGGVLHGRGGIDTLIQTDLAVEMAERASGLRVAADEEFMPFADHSLDLVLSNLSLHWVNDLPGALIQIRRMLRPDGLFLASLLGGETLHELRSALLDAELKVSGGAAPRVSPFADVRDAGGLLQRAGFALPVVDTDTVTVTYADAMALMRDLRGMGETSAVRERPLGFTRRDVLARAAAIYATQFGDAAGRIRATFQVIYLTGWAPDIESQQQPLRPGSARTRLADALGADERPAGDKTPRRKP
ncbi:MAG: methyltransferase domain-containing protein [Alphaproteobacteria bacterium]|nr:methyltransferase domain-containing protein [Alphaproteobacteria bacterium]